ncbi:MAG TPA: T9SS type A sorting domain-containing protein [Clostridia bacterium]|nr:T9SS type A sorting domain-containing protein [Clostridia bacterium]
MFRSIFFFTALILITLMSNSNAATYYIDNVGGNDGNTGLSTSTPWKTFAKVCNTSLASGSIVSFKCDQRFSATTSFNKSNITVNSYGAGARPVFDGLNIIVPFEMTGTNITLNGLKIVNGFPCNASFTGTYITVESCNIDSNAVGTGFNGNPGSIWADDNTNYLTIRNSTISYNRGGSGIYIAGAHNTVMEYDTVNYNQQSGIRVADGVGGNTTDNLTIRYCVSRFNGTDPSTYGYAHENDGMTNSNVYYNLFESCYGWTGSMILWQRSGGIAPSNCNYYNNTIITHGGCAIQIGNSANETYTNITGMVFKNNIFYNDAGTYGLYFIGASSQPTNWTFNNNLYYGLTSSWHLNSDLAFSGWKAWGYDSKGLNTNPLFTSSSNFTLQPSSPSVNAGVNVSLTQDIVGDPVVGNPDLGAYELKSPLPVELTTFSGIFINNSVRLTWSTATEINNQGFDIERNTNSSWVKIGFIEGKGNSVTKNDYSFEDKTPVGSTIQYRLKQIDNNGNFKYYDVISVTAILQDFSIGNYPNPFNPSTKIRYSIPSESMINLVIYNLIGERIDELKNEIQQTGTYETNWNGSGHPSGIYFLSIIESPVNGSTKISKIIKMNLIK